MWNIWIAPRKTQWRLFHVEHLIAAQAYFSIRIITSDGENSIEKTRDKWSKSSGAHKEESPQRMRHWNGFLPNPSVIPLDLREITCANPNNHLPRSRLLRAGPLEKSGEFAECSRTDIIQRSHFLVQFLIAPDENLGILKSKLTNDFR